jgi:hypothetical protein
VFADPVGARAIQSAPAPLQFVNVTVSVLPGGPVVGPALRAGPVTVTV